MAPWPLMWSMASMPNEIYQSATVDRLEGEKAVLRFSDGQELVWSVKDLPAGSREGTILKFKIMTDAKMEADQKAMAQEILNEIFTTDDNSGAAGK